MSVTGNLKIDPALQAALLRAQTLLKNNMADASVLKDFFNPQQMLVQVIEQSGQLFSSLNWLSILQNMQKPEFFQATWLSYLDIQKASVSHLSNSQKQLFDDVLADIKKSGEALAADGDSQEKLAEYINTNLDGYEKIQPDMQRQSLLMGSINSAYMAWLQTILQKASV